MLQTYKNLIDNSINLSNNNISKLLPYFFKIDNNISITIKHFLNNLFDNNILNYIEIGNKYFPIVLYQNYIKNFIITDKILNADFLSDNNILYSISQTLDKYNVILLSEQNSILSEYYYLVDNIFICISNNNCNINEKLLIKHFEYKLDDITIYIFEKKRFNILFSGWLHIPHSYAIIFCNQLINFYKYYNDFINFYVEEVEYASSNWIKDKLFYNEYNSILENIFKPYDNKTSLHLNYRIAFPYNITNRYNCQTCIFFTSEYKQELKYLILNNSIVDSNYSLLSYSKNNKIFYTTPSIFSYKQSLFYNTFIDCKVIPHGIDPTLFSPITSSEKSLLRKSFNIRDDDIVLLHVGSMTSNKGLIYILNCMHILVNMYNRDDFILFFKACSSLYQCNNNITLILQQLQLNQIQIDNLLRYIYILDISTDSKSLKNIYGLSDIYLSPYIIEGFNIPPLEALSCGLDLIISNNGSTEQYINDIYNNGGSDFIYKLNCKIKEETNENIIDVFEIVQYLLGYRKKIKNNTNMINYITKHYSWKNICNSLLEYFFDI